MLRAMLFVLATLLPQGGFAQDFAALDTPGAIAIMRHALAPGTGDPAEFDVEDCKTQRNLDARGQDQARRIGLALGEAGISFDHVWSSQWCRCLETAELMKVGPITAQPALNSFFRQRERAGRQIAELLDQLEALPDTERAMLVTHQVNITALTGVFPASGEIVIIRLTDAGEVEVLDQIAIAP